VRAEVEHELRKVGTCGVDLTFAAQAAASPESEYQIQTFTRIQYLLVAYNSDIRKCAC